MVDPTAAKAFLFDVDKTLTNSARECTPATQAALKKLRSLGKKVGVCTGRHYTTLHQEILCLFEPDDLHVVSGGAQVIKTDGTIVWEQCIPHATVTQLIHQLDAHATRIYLQEGSSIYGNQQAIAEWKIVIGSKHQLEIKPLSMLPAVDIPIIVVHEIDEQIFDSIRMHPELSAKYMQNYTGKFYADITAAGVSKETGVRQWCARQNVAPGEVVGFGDSENDIEFLTMVGYGVAMGNATEEVKKIAQEVTLTLDEDGIAAWVNSHF